MLILDLLLLKLGSCLFQKQTGKFLGDHNGPKPVQTALLLDEGKLSLDLLILAVNDRGGSLFQVFLGDVGARVEVADGERLGLALERGVRCNTPSQLHFLPTGVEPFEELLIVIQKESLVLVV